MRQQLISLIVHACYMFLNGSGQERIRCAEAAILPLPEKNDSDHSLSTVTFKKIFQ